MRKKIDERNRANTNLCFSANEAISELIEKITINKNFISEVRVWVNGFSERTI